MKTNEVIEVVRKAFDDAKINYEYFAEEGVIKTVIQIGGKLGQANVQIDVREAGLNLFVISPVSADKRFLKELLEFLALVNTEGIIGSFNVDLRNGMIYLKYNLITLWLESLPKEAVTDIVQAAGNAFWRFGDGIVEVNSGSNDPVSVFTQIKTAEHLLSKFKK